MEQKVSCIDAIKVDVEGYEDRALLPYFDHVAREGWPKTILIETVLRHRWERDCLIELGRRGYQRAAATSENVILRLAG